MDIKWFFSKSFLMNRNFLWPLFLINLLGTIYGYIWYDGQIQWTIANFENWRWLLVFVPDSPTASLFFTIAVLFMLYPPKGTSRLVRWFRTIIEALAVVCSVKYGIWATAIIIAGATQGETLEWQSYMLMTSHLAMAFEALLYVRFMRVGGISLIIATGWLLLNDTLDYHYGIYPFLPRALYDYVTEVKWFTISLSLASLIAAYLVWKKKIRS